MLFKGSVDNLGVFECELFCDRATARFGVGLLVDTLENPEPSATLVAGIAGSGPVAKPPLHPLRR